MLKGHTCPGSDFEREPLELLSHCAGLPTSRLIAEPEMDLPHAALDSFARTLQRRLRHEPIAQILGYIPFLGRDFTVTRATLVPRPATEAIADIAVRTLADPDIDLALDIGTGCGCIAVSMAAARNSAKVVGTDLSPAALQIAHMNAQKLGLGDAVDFRHGDLLLPAANDVERARAMVLMANLPYLPTEGIPTLSPDVIAFEPGMALDGGPDGLDLYRRMLDQTALYAKRTDVRLFIELLPEQYELMFGEIGERFPGSEVAEISYAGTIIGLAARLKTG